MTPDERQALIDRLENEIRPLLDEAPHEDPPGYNCCGCATYDEILDHAIAIVKGEPPRGAPGPGWDK